MPEAGRADRHVDPVHTQGPAKRVLDRREGEGGDQADAGAPQPRGDGSLGGAGGCPGRADVGHIAGIDEDGHDLILAKAGRGTGQGSSGC